MVKLKRVYNYDKTVGERVVQDRERLLESDDILVMLNISKSTLERWLSGEYGSFPEPDFCHGRARKWLEGNVIRWIDEKHSDKES